MHTSQANGGARAPPPPPGYATDRHAVHNLSAVLSASGQQIDRFNVNRSSIQRARQKHREVTSKKLKSEFCREQTLTLHWDGKLMAELTGDKKSIGSRL